MTKLEHACHLLVWDAYVAVIDQGIPLVEDDPSTGERSWTPAMMRAMLRHLRLEYDAANLLRLHRWLMAHATEPDYSRWQ